MRHPRPEVYYVRLSGKDRWWAKRERRPYWTLRRERPGQGLRPRAGACGCPGGRSRPARVRLAHPARRAAVLARGYGAHEAAQAVQYVD